MGLTRYQPWRDADDPLLPPPHVAAACDEIGAAVLAGATPAEALNQLLRRGPADLRGLADLRHLVQERQYALRLRGKLHDTLRQARELLTQALAEERRALFPDPGDEARLREGELATLPTSTARAVRQLRGYAWRSPAARARYAEITELLRQDVLEARFRGLRQWLHGATPPELRRLRAMLTELNQLVDADGRGESTRVRFSRFVAEYDDFFPAPQTGLAALLDALARHAAAAERVLSALTADQRYELAELASQTLGDPILQAEMSALSRALQVRRPDLDWSGPPLGEHNEDGAGVALAELTELGDLEEALAQRHPGASMDDVDPELLDRVLGPQALADLRRLRAVERGLVAEGYLTGSREQLALTAKAVRRLADTALREMWPERDRSLTARQSRRPPRTGGEPSGGRRPWRFGDENPLDPNATLANALRRGGLNPPRLVAADFEVVEVERPSRAAVAVCVDLSFAMVQDESWLAMKRAALAVTRLAATRHRLDAIQIIGFGRTARVISPAEMVTLDWNLAQGTNLHHALVLASRHLRGHPRHQPLVLLIAGGEPTAHLSAAGEAVFSSPPQPQTVRVTMRAVDTLTALGARIDVLRPGKNPRLDHLATTITRRNGGRVIAAPPDRLGARVIERYLAGRQRPEW
jgi:uncharacterized protein with von Willebrand factor type A (vWA) domain